MSVFSGTILEYPQISLDRFDRDNLKSTAFFLSHFHSDHTVGLDSDYFFQRLKEYNCIKLYCHEVTACFLRADERYARLNSHIEYLPTDDSVLLPIPATKNKSETMVTVSTIPAGHCPGSVMFLFEGSSGSALYTGDFRFHVGDAALRPEFRKYIERSATLNSAYVDTTFFNRSTFSIPSREDCCEVICDLITQWLDKPGVYIGEKSRRAVHVSTMYDLGYEFLLVQLSKKFKTKIHVSEDQYQRYRFVHSIASCLSRDSDPCSIHFCRTYGSYCCNRQFGTNTLRIQPSAMYFTRPEGGRAAQLVETSEPSGVVRVCYSTHSSYEEIIDFMRTIRPENISANVCPKDCKNVEEATERIQFLRAGGHPDTNMPGKQASPKQGQSQIKFKKRRVTTTVD
jgi:DNA cross-link repair 1C protein